MYILTFFVVISTRQRHSFESITCLDNAIFPENDITVIIYGRLLCWLPNCWRCELSPEAVGIHSDCFSLFREECKAEDALDRLWVAAARNPGAERQTSILIPAQTSL